MMTAGVVTNRRLTLKGKSPNQKPTHHLDNGFRLDGIWKEEDEQYDGYDGAGRGSAVHNAGYRKRNAASAGRGLWVTFARI